MTHSHKCGNNCSHHHHHHEHGPPPSWAVLRLLNLRLQLMNLDRLEAMGCSFVTIDRFNGSLLFNMAAVNRRIEWRTTWAKE